MEKVSKTVVEEEVYVAEDGSEFDNKYECEIYEKYYKRDILDLVKGYIVFDEKGKESVAKSETPYGSYAVCLEQLPHEIAYYIETYINMHHKAKDLVPFCGKYDKNELYVCDYSEAMNGRYGWNGWKSLGTKREIEAEINRKERHLAILNSLLPKEEE